MKYVEIRKVVLNLVLIAWLTCSSLDVSDQVELVVQVFFVVFATIEYFKINRQAHSKRIVED